MAHGKTIIINISRENWKNNNSKILSEYIPKPPMWIHELLYSIHQIITIPSVSQI